MQILTQQKTEHTPLIKALYTAVDSLDAGGVVDQVTNDVRFQLGNHEALNGREKVKAANEGFFSTIKAMRHSITGIWSIGDTALCDGSVHYTRKDLSEIEVPFAAHLDLRGGKISDYRVFVDLSEL